MLDVEDHGLYRSEALLTDADWTNIEVEIGFDNSYTQLDNCLHYLRHRLGACCVLVESSYIDRDHRASHSLFYSRQFLPTNPVCTRFHFFSSSFNATSVLHNIDPETYLGYIVRRPFSVSPIGRTVLSFSESMSPFVRCYCIAQFGPHIDTQRMGVWGAPFCQQDSSVMTCAETSIWIASRIMTKLFGHKLILPADITSLATIGFSSHGRLLPSGGLDSNQMTHALTSLGFAPLSYSKTSFDLESGTRPRTSTERLIGASDGDQTQSLASLAEWRPIELLAPYLLSSIPAVALVPGHAVTVCGVTLRERNRVHASTSSNVFRLIPTREWIGGLVIQDDAEGPYRLVPLDADERVFLNNQDLGDLLSEGVDSVSSDIDEIIVPLPDRIYLSAIDAEQLAISHLQPNHGILGFLAPLIELAASQGVTASSMLVEALHGGHGGLVYSLRCRRGLDFRRDYGSHSDTVREVLQNTPLPRYVWVAEITSYDIFIRDDPDARFVLGTICFDATAHGHDSSKSYVFAHFAGVVFARPGVPRGDMSHVVRLVPDDHFIQRSGIPLWTDR